MPSADDAVRVTKWRPSGPAAATGPAGRRISERLVRGRPSRGGRRQGERGPGVRAKSLGSTSSCCRTDRIHGPAFSAVLPRAALLLGLAARLKDDNRGLHGAARGVGIEVLLDLSPLGPQTLSLLALCCPARDLARTVYRSTVTSVRLEVEPPGRFAVAPAVHGHGDEVRAVFKVADDHSTGAARTAPDRVKTHGAPTAGLRSPQTESATGPAVQAAMGDPGEPDEPAVRKSCLLGFRVRHVSDLGVVGLGRLAGSSDPRPPAARSLAEKDRSGAPVGGEWFRPR